MRLEQYGYPKLGTELVGFGADTAGWANTQASIQSMDWLSPPTFLISH